MGTLLYARKNRFSLILFLLFSILFIISGIPGVYTESNLYGTGYYMSSIFFNRLLTFVPFILCTVCVFLLVRRRHVLTFDDTGLLDQRYLIKSVFIPWKDVSSFEIKKDKKYYKLYLFIKTKDIMHENAKKQLTISLKDIDCNVAEIDVFLNNIMTNSSNL